MNNNSMWARSRIAHKRHSAAKRKVFDVLKRNNRTYLHLETACKRYMDAQALVIGHLEVDQVEVIQEAYTRFRQAKLDHDASRKDLADAFEAFHKDEIRYAILIFKGLRHIGTKMTNIAKVFGFTSSTMSRWINSDEEELNEYYDNEFGCK